MFPKLVRDKIPDIIISDGKTVVYRKAVNDDEFKEYLNKKLLEEVNEYLENNDVKELADILEVVYTIGEVNGISNVNLDNDRRYKEFKNGNFSNRLIIEEVKE